MNGEKKKVQKTDEPKTVDEPKVDESKQPTWRQVILETNGTKVRVVKAEVAGDLEFIALLQTLLNSFNK